MNNLLRIIKEKNLHPKRYQKIKNVYVISSNNHDYVIKQNTNNYDIYKYLLSRDFNYFPENFNTINDNYDLSEYIKDESLNKTQKINDYIEILAILHQKTSYIREINLDEIKKEYEELNEKIMDIRKYYINLNDLMDKEMFLSPSMYLLVRNISLIYALLDNSSLLLQELYENIKNKKSIRVSLLHNNIDLDHLIVSDNRYLISWDKAYFESPVYDLEKFYRRYFLDIELNDFINVYERINKLTREEKMLLIIKLAVPSKIELSYNTYLDTRIINGEINYLNKIYELLVFMKKK